MTAIPPTWPSINLYPSSTTWPSDGIPDPDPGINAWQPLQTNPRADSVRYRPTT